MPSNKSLFALALILAALPLAGCTISGRGTQDALDSVATGSIAKPVPAEEPDQLSDSRTVRNAVSSANISASETQPLAWANADTGASGLITGIHQFREGSRICRSFKTSRQRFDGVAQYVGEACTHGEGEWRLTQFAEGTTPKTAETSAPAN